MNDIYTMRAREIMVFMWYDKQKCGCRKLNISPWAVVGPSYSPKESKVVPYERSH